MGELVLGEAVTISGLLATIAGVSGVMGGKQREGRGGGAQQGRQGRVILAWSLCGLPPRGRVISVLAKSLAGTWGKLSEV